RCRRSLRLRRVRSMVRLEPVGYIVTPVFTEPFQARRMMTSENGFVTKLEFRDPDRRFEPYDFAATRDHMARADPAKHDMNMSCSRGSGSCFFRSHHGSRMLRGGRMFDDDFSRSAKLGAAHFTSRGKVNMQLGKLCPSSIT